MGWVSKLMVHGNIVKTLSGFERLLLPFGLLLVCLYASGRICSVVYSRALVREFWRNHTATSSQLVDSFQPNPGIPNFHLWSQKRIEAYQQSLTTNISAPMGVLKIPPIGIEAPVLEGTGDLTLNRGVGYIDGTPLPGEAGNTGIAGHRDGFFRGLKDLHLGDSLDLYTEHGNTRYVVDVIHIVTPEDMSVLAPRQRSSVTLVTCYPLYFVGSAPLRYIVHASTTEAIHLKASGHSDPLEEGGGRDKK